MFAQEAPDFSTATMWAEGLFGLDWANTETNFTMEFSPYYTGQIADHWEVTDTQIIVTIRDDVYFQDKAAVGMGEYDIYGARQLKAEDVKWSYDRLMGTGSGFTEPIPSMVDWRGMFSMVDSIETDGDYTVIFNCNDTSEIAMDHFIVNGFLVHIVGPEYGNLTPEQQNDWRYAGGTGPYIAVEYEDSSYMTYKKNPNYYDYDERHPENRLPYLDEVTFVNLQDTASILSQFMAGELDVVGSNNQDVFTDAQKQQIADTMAPGSYVAWGKYSNSLTLAMKQTIEPLKDPNVRQALQYAIDLRAINDQYFGYDELRLSSYFGEGTGFETDWDANPEMYASYTTYDPELAKQMLSDAGYPDGFDLTLTYDPSGDTDIIELVQFYLSQVGVNLTLDPQSDATSRQAHWTDTTGNYIATMDMGTRGFSNGLNSITSTDSNYRYGKEDTMDQMVADIRAAKTLDELTTACKTLNDYYAEQHYSVYITPYRMMDTYVSGKVGGWDKPYNFYMAYTDTIMMARIWNVNGAG